MKGHARNIMTNRVSAIEPDTPLGDIARLLAAGGFSGTPVVDEDQRVLGFVSETDLVEALLHGRGVDVAAAEIMSTPAVTVDEFERLEEVMRVLREHRIHHLPVVREGLLVGIITPADVIRFLVEQLLPIPPAVG
jgi:CBS domain-containing protein